MERKGVWPGPVRDFHLDANLFFRLVRHRYQRGSILITTNKGIRDWPEILAGDEASATAILDRFTTAMRSTSREESID